MGGVPESVWKKVQAVKEGGGGLTELGDKVGGCVSVFVCWLWFCVCWFRTPGAGTLLVVVQPYKQAESDAMREACDKQTVL